MEIRLHDLPFAIDPNDPRDVVEAIEALVKNLDECAPRFRRFMERCCEPLLGSFPSDAAAWYATALEYRHGRVSAAELTEARRAAWQMSDALERQIRTDPSNQVLRQQNSAVRAVICLLFPDEARHTDWVFAVDLFADWCNSFQQNREDQARWLWDAFADILGPRPIHPEGER